MENLNDDSSSDELDHLTWEELHTVAKRQRELLYIAIRDISCGRINECCIRGCLEMDIATEYHHSEKVQVCGMCTSNYCSDHHDATVVPYSGIICSKCWSEDFICVDCFKGNAAAFTCLHCTMLARMTADCEQIIAARQAKRVKGSGTL